MKYFYGSSNGSNNLNSLLLLSLKILFYNLMMIKTENIKLACEQKK